MDTQAPVFQNILLQGVQRLVKLSVVQAGWQFLVLVNVEIENALGCAGLEDDADPPRAWTGDLFCWNIFDHLHDLYDPSPQNGFIRQIVHLQRNVEIRFHGGEADYTSVHADAVFPKCIRAGLRLRLQCLNGFLEVA